MRAPTCPYCNNPSILVTGDDLYPHIPALRSKSFYRCAPCKAHVGCHPGTTKPLGRLANAELRRLKMDAHAAFDHLWAGGRMKRASAYKWLAGALGIDPKTCHIGMFNEDECRAVVDVVSALRQTTEG